MRQGAGDLSILCEADVEFSRRRIGQQYQPCEYFGANVSDLWGPAIEANMNFCSSAPPA
jgi:hypothetical protein